MKYDKVVSLRLLIVEDSAEDAELLLAALRDDGFDLEPRLVADEPAFLAALDEPLDLILADYTLPRLDAPRMLALLKERGSDVPLVVVTGSVGEERAVACMRDGAADCLLKDRLARLGPAVRSALETRRDRQEKRHAEEALRELTERLQRENRFLRDELRGGDDFGTIIGTSPRLVAVLEVLRKVAPTDVTLLVQGETGTGKELVARAVHAASPRAEHALVTVNCAALAPTLIESELFGHGRGAFTGATARSEGRFELAHGGTLFLDEVGELPLAVQAKLLRVLQEGEYERVGESRTLKVDVRVIAATNRDLRAEVRAGHFRADLYYRLAVFPVELPPLRERQGDLPILADELARRLARKHGRRYTGIEPESQEALARYPWPGNVRELQNVIERAVIISTGPEVVIDLGLPVDASELPTLDEDPVATARRSLLENEAEHIRRVLQETSGRIEGKDGAAAILGINANTLRSRMKKLGIDRR
jgi:DNA-binding NtrC family response regulator